MTRIARIKHPSQLPFLIRVIRVIRGCASSAWLSGGIPASGEATSDSVSCTRRCIFADIEVAEAGATGQ